MRLALLKQFPVVLIEHRKEPGQEGSRRGAASEMFRSQSAYQYLGFFRGALLNPINVGRAKMWSNHVASVFIVFWRVVPRPLDL